MPPQQTPVSRPAPIVPAVRPVVQPAPRPTVVTPPPVAPAEKIETPQIASPSSSMTHVELASSALTEPSPPSSEPAVQPVVLPKPPELPAAPTKPAITVVEDNTPKFEAQIIGGMPARPPEPEEATVFQPTIDASLLVPDEPENEEAPQALSVLRPMPIPQEPKAKSAAGPFGSADTPELRTDRLVALVCGVVGLVAFGLGFVVGMSALVGGCLGLYGCLRGREIQAMPAIALGMTAVVLNAGLYIVAIALS